MATMGHQSKLLTVVKIKVAEIFSIDLRKNISLIVGRIFHLNGECLHAHLACKKETITLRLTAL